MNLPKTIKVASHEYRVLFPYQFTERNDLNGQCDFAPAEIRVAEKDSYGMRRTEAAIFVTFIHEIIHAIDQAWNAKLSEDQTCAMAEGIAAVLADNEYFAKDR